MITDAKKKLPPAVEAIQIIRKKEGDKRRVAGTIECPECKGELNYSIASNGHIWGKCKCGLAWMM